MNKDAYALAMYRGKPGQEEQFIRIRNERLP
jgi:hypothetical protein